MKTKINLTMILCITKLFMLSLFQSISAENNNSTNPIYLGPVIGVVMSSHNSASSCDCEYTTKKSLDLKGQGFYTGLMVELNMNKPSETNSAVIFRIVYEKDIADASILSGDVPVLINQGDHFEVYNNHYLYEINYELSSIEFDFYYKKNFFQSYPFGIVFGAMFGFPLEKRMIVSYKYQSPDSLIVVTPPQNDYINDGKTHEIYNKEIENPVPLKIGLHVQLQYELKLNKNIYIVPEIAYTYPLMKVQKESKWTMTSFYSGISLKFLMN